MSSLSKRLPTFFLSHGGGPWSYMTGEMRELHSELEVSLKSLRGKLPADPKAILVISGHWEEQKFTISSSPKPPMIYDYSGFPPETYRVQYSAPGSPELAGRVQSLIQVGGQVGGMTARLSVAFPEARIPVVQVSIREDYDPETHLALGRALAPLRDEGVLIVGSGLSYHNLRRFDERARTASAEFDQWLRTTLLESEPAERTKQLRSWAGAPSARAAHPREDHLIPLMAAVGAAEGEKASLFYHEDDFFGGISVSSFQFG
jgi:aromatic ring-opening dioxygenase catalytic subunit (LigB family)